MARLQIYRELLSLTTFLQVHSNSEEVSYLCWQNTYPYLKTTSYIKLKFFLWTKLLENLLHPKYLISVTATLICKKKHFLNENFQFNLHLQFPVITQNSNFVARNHTFDWCNNYYNIWKSDIFPTTMNASRCIKHFCVNLCHRFLILRLPTNNCFLKVCRKSLLL